MPLHLLGKKSWNVYNTDNIERVRRDEAAAEEREAEEERRMQEVDAERRIKILKGLRPDTPPPAPVPESSRLEKGGIEKRSSAGSERPPKRRRKLAGEDDTDRDIRFAKEDAENTSSRVDEQVKVTKTSNAPITDPKGHINLFPMNERGGPRSRPEKNPEAEAELAKKKREYENQYTMRFSNAAGFKQGLEKPWYSSLAKSETLAGGDSGEHEVAETIGKDVWGNEDPGRRNREKSRIEAGDPLASMKSGVKRLKEIEKEKKRRTKERDREFEDPIGARKKKRRHEHDGTIDDLEGFCLDGDTALNRSKNQEALRMDARNNRSHHRSRSRDAHKSSDKIHRHRHLEHHRPSQRSHGKTEERHSHRRHSHHREKLVGS
ncbi:MAG: hypothetical protein M4579_000959 [Chaenotheca gracillima]|nr:MAG: hypothetical protein M4579_000959 [Chaenotheca gracillima]